MTFQPPPPPPGTPPPPPGGTPPPAGPPSGQWGPPPGGQPPQPGQPFQPAPGQPVGSGGSGAFDPKSVNPLDWGIVAAGLLAFLLSFIAFYDGADVSSGGRTGTVDGTASAWNDVIGGGFFSWFAMLFAILGAAAVAIALFAPQVKLPLPARVASLGLFGLALLFEIIGIFVTPGDSESFPGAGSIDVSLNHGFGFWASLVVILAGTVLALMRAQQTNTALPGPFNNIPKIGK